MRFVFHEDCFRILGGKNCSALKFAPGVEHGNGMPHKGDAIHEGTELFKLPHAPLALRVKDHIDDGRPLGSFEANAFTVFSKFNEKTFGIEIRRNFRQRRPFTLLCGAGSRKCRAGEHAGCEHQGSTGKSLHNVSFSL